MPAFAWSCLACGSRNDPTYAACSSCGCPSECSIEEIAEFRSRFESAGGSVGPKSGMISTHSLLATAGGKLAISLLSSLRARWIAVGVSAIAFFSLVRAASWWIPTPESSSNLQLFALVFTAAFIATYRVGSVRMWIALAVITAPVLYVIGLAFVGPGIAILATKASGETNIRRALVVEIAPAYRPRGVCEYNVTLSIEKVSTNETFCLSSAYANPLKVETWATLVGKKSYFGYSVSQINSESR